MGLAISHLTPSVGDGTGQPDDSNTSAEVLPGAGMLDGWRWFRFRGAFTRSGGTPVLDDLRVDFETDSAAE